MTDDLDVTTDLLVIISPVDATLTWNSSVDANNSAVGIKANIPFLLANLNTTEYSAVPSTRTSNALTHVITTVRIYQASGSSQRVRVITFD